MIVPWQKLSADALSAVIEEYVSRDGTEHTDVEVKATQVRDALKRGELVLVFDADTESCNLLPPAEVPEPGTAYEVDDDPELDQRRHEDDFETP